ncbi:MAG: transglutaminase domain-containing protein [Saprospiraceae bacterium]|nr:transglutaminase domain-containing protein [Saprospiraceae bacterium]
MKSQRLITFERAIEYRVVQGYDAIYTAALPQDIPGRQEVINIEYSDELTRVYHDDGNLFAEFSTRNAPRVGVFRIRSHLWLYDYDLREAQRADSVFLEENLEPYLVQEENIEILNPRLRNAADSLTGSSELDLVRRIFEFVVAHLDYFSYSNQNRGAAQALKQERGDCTEYSELMVALCRARGIPARIVYGAVARPSRNPHHNWVEVHLSDYGWVPFDPTHADCTSCRTTFENLENKYIKYSNDRFHLYIGWRVERRPGVQARSRVPNPVSVDYSYSVEDHTARIVQKAQSHYRRQQHGSALALVDSLLADGFEDFLIVNLRANICRSLDWPAEALGDLQRAGRLVVSDADKQELLYSFALLFAHVDQPDKAISFLKESIESGLPVSRLHDERALKPLANHPEFQAMVNASEVRLVELGNLDEIRGLSYLQTSNAPLPLVAKRPAQARNASAIAMALARDLGIKQVTVVPKSSHNRFVISHESVYAFNPDGTLARRNDGYDQTYTYDAAGRLTTVEVMSPAFLELSRQVTHYDYDVFGRLVRITNRESAGDRDSITSCYEVTLNSDTELTVVSLHEETAQTCRFVFHEQNRPNTMTTEYDGQPLEITWLYSDDFGSYQKWLHFADTSVLIGAARCDTNGHLIYTMSRQVQTTSSEGQRHTAVHTWETHYRWSNGSLTSYHRTRDSSTSDAALVVEIRYNKHGLPRIVKYDYGESLWSRESIYRYRFY